MEIETILALIGAIIGGGGIVGFIVGLLTIKYERHKAQGEAHSAEYEGMKVEQDTYQELILDLKTAWKEQKDYIAELHEVRRNLRIERDDLKKQIDGLANKVNEQQGEIEDLKKIVRSFKPLICSQVGCAKRQSDIIGLISDDSFDTNSNKG
jgi:chromosome segregation ATPase